MDKVEQLRAFIEESRSLWKAPGVAVAVVRGDEVLLCEGFGMRDLEENKPVTTDTLFAIASCSKAFTTFDLGLLVDEGKLDWDTPLRDFLPAFKLSDPVASERLTPRDMVSHRVGLPRHDYMWYSSPYTRQEIFERLRYLEPNKDIRQTFQYNNLMFLTAGVLIQHLTGQTWEEFTRQRIFEPLGMRRSNFSVTDSQQSNDFALPYHEKEDQVERMPFRNIDNTGPAGSINACAADLSKWVQMHLNQGRLDGREIITSGNLEQMHTPQMVIAGKPRWKELLPGSYGLGWFISPYRGYQMVQHGGNIDGFTAMVAMLPDENIGVVALTNISGSSLPTTIAYRVFDMLLNLDPVDWNERFYKDHLEFKAGKDKSKQQSASERLQDRPPAHPLEDYAGEYKHPGYGSVTIRVQDGQLSARYNENEFQVEPYHYEIFDFCYDLIDLRMKGSFTTDEKGNVSRLALPLESNVKEIIFERVPEGHLRERAFLERLIGNYELMGFPLSISLRGSDSLVATLPGQPALELLPYRGTTFTVQGQTGVTLQFDIPETGPAASLTYTQPELSLRAKRIET